MPTRPILMKKLLKSSMRENRILAATSHLPHILAYAMVDVLRKMDGEGGILRCTAGFGISRASPPATRNVGRYLPRQRERDPPLAGGFRFTTEIAVHIPMPFAPEKENPSRRFLRGPWNIGGGSMGRVGDRRVVLSSVRDFVYDLGR
uniref:Uncharacterized protein n=1 Tax=Candidatus Kentrum sp. LFY TaxID=2126342 RepID=A0A450UIV3_9GAMM|nr:MAG: hypothetical protein BECKLFY1418A_GA0070994_102329 [Candidatus Kentron sp. LFY]